MSNNRFPKQLLLLLLFMVYSLSGMAQERNLLDSLKSEYDKTVLLLETAKQLSQKEKDSLIALRDDLDNEMRKFWERILFIREKAADFRGEGAIIEGFLQKDSILSYETRDSLYRIANDLSQRGRETGQYGKLFLNKKDTIETIVSSLVYHQKLLEQEIEALIKIAADEAVFPIDRSSAIFKLATYGQPAAQNFLAKNLANIYFPNSDPGMYGWMSYYAYESHYPCFVALMENKPDWSILTAIEAALRNRIVEEYRANLYSIILDQITKGCNKCRDEILIWYRDRSGDSEDGKRLRENAKRIMAYLANPNRLD